MCNMVTCHIFKRFIKCRAHATAICKTNTIAKNPCSWGSLNKSINTVIHRRRRYIRNITRFVISLFYTLSTFNFHKHIRN